MFGKIELKDCIGNLLKNYKKNISGLALVFTCPKSDNIL